MGWFSRKRSSSDDHGRQAAYEPFVADGQIVARVGELLDQFNDAGGDFNRIHAIGGALCKTAGMPSFQQMITMPDTNPESDLQRQWKMLAAVAHRAAENGDHVLAGKVWAFTSIWNTMVAPRLSKSDWVDVPMAASPAGIETEIATVALHSLMQLPTTAVIFWNATGSVDAGMLTRVAATTVMHAPERGVAVDAATVLMARSVVGQG